MRQAPGEMLKNYLARFTDEITYCEQVTDREAFLALKERPEYKYLILT